MGGAAEEVTDPSHTLYASSVLATADPADPSYHPLQVAAEREAPGAFFLEDCASARELCRRRQTCETLAFDA
jgi:hypothetical protein